jgi:hypothetical protein
VRRTNEDFQRGSNLRNKKSPRQLRAAFRNQFVVRFGLQPQLCNPALFFPEQIEVFSQFVAQVSQAQIDRRLKHAAMGFPQRIVH